MTRTAKNIQHFFSTLLFSCTFMLCMVTESHAQAENDCIVSQDSFPIIDRLRGVQTIAPMIDTIISSVIQITKYVENDDYPYQLRGAGIIVDAERGYVLTNYHVVNGVDAEDIRIILKDRRIFKVNSIGVDKDIDIAILQIRTEEGVTPANLIAMPIGNSDCIKIGDVVVTIGHPGSRQYTVTSGIVSALGRTVGWDDLKYEDFIQTDAAINPGNSGGPLVNTYGELIGINTAASRWMEGVGFAIPSNIAQTVMNQFLEYNEIRRSGIGIWAEDSRQQALLSPLDSQEPLGKEVVVIHVNPDSPADRAGLKEGDVITSVNGQNVENAYHLNSKLHVREHGTTVTLSYYRQPSDEIQKIKVEVQEKQDILLLGESMLSQLTGSVFTTIPSSLTLSLSSIETELKAIYVSKVTADSLAWNNGLREGDIILSFNGLRPTIETSIESVFELKKYVQSLKEDSLTIHKEEEEQTEIRLENKHLILFILRDLKTFLTLTISLETL